MNSNCFRRIIPVVFLPPGGSFPRSPPEELTVPYRPTLGSLGPPFFENLTMYVSAWRVSFDDVRSAGCGGLIDHSAALTLHVELVYQGACPFRNPRTGKETGLSSPWVFRWRIGLLAATGGGWLRASFFPLPSLSALNGRLWRSSGSSGWSLRALIGGPFLAPHCRHDLGRDPLWTGMAAGIGYFCTRFSVDR